MINTIKTILKIESYSNINMYMYYFKHIKIFSNLKITKLSKLLFQLIAILIKFITHILSKIIYVLAILMISKYITKDQTMEIFIHIFIFFSFIGMLINSKITTTNRKKYYSIMLLNMNAKHYIIYSIIIHLLDTFIYNLIILTILFIKYNINFSIPLYLSIISILSKITGEGINLFYYKIIGKTIINTPVIYFITLILLLFLGILLPIIGVIYPINYLSIIIIILIPLATLSAIYISKYNDYKLLYKKLITKDKVLNEINIKREDLINIKQKDYQSNIRNLNKEKPHQYLNKIFFERHKNILLRSAIRYSIVIFILILLILIASLINKEIKGELTTTILSYFPWIVLVMYFINRGSIITQAMFINCDKSLLKFNFYRSPSNINKIFQGRMKTISKVNLIPAFTLSLGLSILLIIDKKLTIVYIFLLSLTIIFLSLFFSMYYLVIYYLLQPYKKDLRIRSFSYQIVNTIMYLVTFSISRIKTTIPIFTSIIIISTIIFISISFLLIKKYAPRTFKIKNI